MNDEAEDDVKAKKKTHIHTKGTEGSHKKKANAG